jgi:hypothetical protein
LQGGPLRISVDSIEFASILQGGPP